MIPIICPTHGRAGRVLVTKAIEGVALCVTKSQVPQYRERHADIEIIEHPDDVVGLAPKRQWIYEKVGSVFMVDDDVASMKDLSKGAGEKMGVSPERARRLIDRLACEAKDLGAYLFGFNPSVDPATCKPLRPFRVTGFVPGHSLGIHKGNKLFFTEESVAVEDYWISLLNAYHHRMAWIDWRYGLEQRTTFKGAGGQAFRRTIRTEEEDTQMLQRYFGRDIVLLKKGTPRASRTHEHQRRMKLPF